jgi:hypothetical protein
MSQSGFTPIQLYRSSTAAAVPTAGNLVAGELAINTTDEKLYFENTSGVVKLLTSSAFVGTVTSVGLSGGTTGLTVSGTNPITSSGTFTLGGTLAVANGGTGVTSSTGTVAVVLSNTPTLVTPILGAATATSLALPNSISLTNPSAETLLINAAAATATMRFRVAGDDRITIAAAGNVLVGTTTTPGTPNARIVAGGTADAGIQISSSNGGGALFLSINGVAGAAFYTHTGAVGSEVYTERMRLDASGNLGIGATNPTSTFGARVLQVQGTADDKAEVRLVHTTSGVGTTDGFTLSLAASDAYVYNRENGPIIFGTNNTERMRITAAGDVGIGTSAPTTGSMSNMAVSNAGLFATLRGRVASTSGVAVTLGTDALGGNETYIVSVGIFSGVPTVYSAVAIVSADGSILRSTTLQTAALMTISVSGTNIQATQSSGGPANIDFSIIRIA